MEQEKRSRFSAAMEQSKQAYQETPVPQDLSRRMERAIAVGLAPKPRQNWSKWAGGMAAGLCACFLLALNTAPAFAQAVYQVPVLGELCRVVTFRSYQQQDETSYVDVQIPQVEVDGQGELAQRVNLEISSAIQQEVEDSRQRAKEYYQAYLETGGKAEEFQPITIKVDYQVKRMSQEYLSFVITKTETLASAYFQQYFYNLDLETGKELTLRDLLGPDYAAIAAAAVEQLLEGWDQEEKALLFDGVDLESLMGEDRGFYLREDGAIVVVFEKYEIAAGAAGVLEFPVGNVSPT